MRSSRSWRQDRGGAGWSMVLARTHMEWLKLATRPGASPGVGLRKHGLLALHRIPCSHGRVPAEGSALLGK